MFKPYTTIVFALALGLGVAGCTRNSQTEQQAEQDAVKGTLLDNSIGRTKAKTKSDRKWSPVTRVKNRKTLKTKLFHITGTEWKIRWKTAPAPGKPEDEFIVILYDKSNEDKSEIIANVTGKDEDFEYLEGQGDYYLSISTTQPYEVVVEQQK